MAYGDDLTITGQVRPALGTKSKANKILYANSDWVSKTSLELALEKGEGICPIYWKEGNVANLFSLKSSKYQDDK